MKSSDPAEHSTVGSSGAEKGQATHQHVLFNPRVGLWLLVESGQPEAEAYGTGLAQLGAFWDCALGGLKFGVSRSSPSSPC